MAWNNLKNVKNETQNNFNPNPRPANWRSGFTYLYLLNKMKILTYLLTSLIAFPVLLALCLWDGWRFKDEEL